MIAVVDFDIGNLSAVLNMFKRLGVACEITSDADKIKRAEKIILPVMGPLTHACRGCAPRALFRCWKNGC